MLDGRGRNVYRVDKRVEKEAKVRVSPNVTSHHVAKVRMSERMRLSLFPQYSMEQFLLLAKDAGC